MLRLARVPKADDIDPLRRCGRGLQMDDSMSRLLEDIAEQLQTVLPALCKFGGRW